MATNNPSSDGHRDGMVRDRFPTYNPKTTSWVNRDVITDRFMDHKANRSFFKGIRKAR